MTRTDLGNELERRSPGDWELYEKRADSRELVSAPTSRRRAHRIERGWAARWWENGGARFACGSSEDELARALRQSGRGTIAATPPPAWPSSKSPAVEPHAAEPPAEDLFAELSRLLAAESRGEAILAELSVRRGVRTERLVNGAGADVSMRSEAAEGVARAIGRREGRACEARALFRWDAGPDLQPLARRLSDRATLPLSERAASLAHGEWLLDPSVAAPLLAAAAPLLTAGPLPTWLQRSQLFSTAVTIVDDASADGAFDGEATSTRRVVLVEEGALRARLYDLSSARADSTTSTGHGVRPSYRTPPAPGPRRLFLQTSRGASPRDLLAGVRRGVFASALTAPIRMDFARDRFEVEFTGVSVVAGRAQGPVAGARAKGRMSQLFRRIAGVGTDRQFFPCPYPTGAPTLLIERAEFD